MIEGLCDSCQRRAVLAPLHGDKGGPLRCYICAGKWHAEYGRRRNAGRVVIRAIKAFMDAGGDRYDINKLVVTASVNSGLFADGSFFDLFGYMAETAIEADETVVLTSELLADVVRLVHPDLHPPERHDLATDVTRRLLALRPFTFPAVERKKREEPIVDNPQRVDSSPPSRKEARFPCADCAFTIPLNYCSACRAGWDEIQRETQAKKAAKTRERLARRKARRPKPACAGCGKPVEGKRADARFCSNACRQATWRSSAAASP